MGAFFDAVVEFPTVLFSFVLVVVVAYWAVLLVGLDHGDWAHGLPGVVAGSVGVLAGWLVSLIGATLVRGALLRGLLLVVAMVAAVGVARVLAGPLRRVLGGGGGESRAAFVGRSCVIRTGSVSASFGQAEVTAADGSSAIVQVRQTGTDVFRAGSVAHIYGYDPDGEFFWVVPNPGQELS